MLLLEIRRKNSTFMAGRVSLCDQRIRLGSVEVGGDQEMQHSLFYNLEKSERKLENYCLSLVAFNVKLINDLTSFLT